MSSMSRYHHYKERDRRDVYRHAREEHSHRRRSKHRRRSHHRSRSRDTNKEGKYDNVHINKFKERDSETDRKEICEKNGKEDSTQCKDSVFERSRRNARAALLVKLENESKIKQSNVSNQDDVFLNDMSTLQSKQTDTLDKDFLNIDTMHYNGNNINVIKDNNITHIDTNTQLPTPSPQHDSLDEYMKLIESQATIQHSSFLAPSIATFDDISTSHPCSETTAASDEVFLSTLKDLPASTPHSIIYQEDHSEHIAGVSSSVEDQWRKLKSSSDHPKELKPVNHSLIAYEAFRKNIYIESPEIAKLSESDIALLRKNNSDIKIRGKNPPKPILTWYHCGLNTTIMNILTQRNITKPFPIQMQAIPSIMSGRDVIATAETGSGKTLAYVLPMLRHVMDQRPLRESEGPIALILVPTRELAVQVYQEVRIFTKYLSLNVCCVYGGTAIGQQISELRRGCEIVIATPGRMIELLCLSNGKITNLLRVTYVVIDEGDRMLDMGFEPQISRIIANIRPSRQTVMFSATFPKQIECLAKKILTKPLEIVIGTRGQSSHNITQHVEVIPKARSFLRLMEILDEHAQVSTIIFADSQSESVELWKQLFKQGYQCNVVHGGMDQEDRIDAVSSFKRKECSILISTSICARGLDVAHCELVINFRCPNHMEDYIHRIGRTGRAGKHGTAYTFISPDDEDHLAWDVMKAMELSGQEVPGELRELVRKYRYKKENGEVDRVRISGYIGHGYQFTRDENERHVIERKLIGSGYEDENAIDENEIKENLKKLYNNANCTAVSVRQKSLKDKHESKMKLISRDDKAKQIAIDVGMNAAKAAIISGKNEDEILPIVQDAISKALANYKPSVSIYKGVENASKIIENWEECENIRNHIYTCELDINDYPLNARIAGMKKENINNICEINNVDIIIKGTYIEPGKKILPGQKRLCLYIKGQNQSNVNSAYIELKRQFDENALLYYTTNSNYLHKYNI